MRLQFSYGARAVRVVFGDGATDCLGAELQALERTRVLLIGTPGRAAQLAAIRETLGGLVVGTFEGARLHVPGEVVDAALGEARRCTPDVLLAVGGGSAIGLAKALAHQTGFTVAAVPTTYSGSEMTSIWGRTDGAKKLTERDERAAPSLVVYDPLLTLGLSAKTSAASGMNAIAHAVEAFYAPDTNPIANLFATQALRLLGSALPHVVGSPDDRDARRNALLGAHFAGCALDLTSMGLHHKLCHVLGGTFGLDHALTHAVLLPHVAAFNAAAAPEAMVQVAGALGATDAVEGLRALQRSLGITETLRDLGLRQEDIDRAAELATSRSYPNPRSATREDIALLLGRAWGAG